MSADTFCTACGNPLSSGAQFCGRCGFAVAADEPSDPSADATRQRSSLTTPEDETVAVAAVAQDDQSTQSFAHRPPPVATASIPSGEPWTPRRVAPPEIWLVAVGLFVLAGLVVYPVARFTPDLIDGAVTGSRLARAFSTLVLEFVVLFWAAGLALVALAVGLVRGSRVAQLLTCVLSGAVAIAELVAASQTGGYVVPPSDGLVAGVVVCCVLIVALVTAPPTARAYFAGDPRPAGVSLAVTANVYLGAVALLDAVLLCLAGIAGVEYVWIGLSFAVVGAALIVVARALHAGSPPARVITIVLYVGLFAAVLTFGAKTDELGSPTTLIPAAILLAAAVGLTVPASSQEHFRVAGGSVPLSRPAALTSLVAMACVVAAAVFGFDASSADTPGGAYAYQGNESYARQTSGPVIPTYGSGIDYSAARSTATGLLDALEGSGTAPMCNGQSPDLSVYDYAIRDVTEDTSGSFSVTADVTLDDGSYYHVTYVVEDDGTGTGCVDDTSVSTEQYSPDDDLSNQPQVPQGSGAPSDVPAVVTAGEAVPDNAPLPSAPSGAVVSYDDSTTVPTTEDEIVEYQPSGLDTDQADAVRSVIAFMTHVNQQDFQPAWDHSTERLVGSDYDSAFADGYRTSHFMQVAFGQPEQVSPNLIIVPGRFASRQDPAAQGNPDGVTDCTYWPQYMFLVAQVDGRWLLDVARKYQDRSAVAPYKRASQSGQQLNPVEQRVAC